MLVMTPFMEAADKTWCAAATVTTALWGGPGNDRVLGGSGADVLLGGEGADSLRGDSQDDVLWVRRWADDISQWPRTRR